MTCEDRFMTCPWFGSFANRWVPVRTLLRGLSDVQRSMTVLYGCDWPLAFSEER